MRTITQAFVELYGSRSLRHRSPATAPDDSGRRQRFASDGAAEESIEPLPSRRPPTPRVTHGPVLREESTDEMPHAEISSLPPTRPIRFAPLEPLASVEPRSTGSRARHATRTLKVPRLVRCLLDACPDDWRRIVRGLEDRQSAVDLRCILVASAASGEGCTTIATALSMALAKESDRRVLLLDGDRADAGLARLLRLDIETGLDSVLANQASLDDALISFRDPPLTVLPLVHGSPLDDTLFDPRRVAAILGALRDAFDLIVIDGGSVSASSANIGLTAFGSTRSKPGVDAALLVRRPDRTAAAPLDRLRSLLNDHDISCLGMIENAVA